MIPSAPKRGHQTNFLRADGLPRWPFKAARSPTPRSGFRSKITNRISARPATAGRPQGRMPGASTEGKAPRSAVVARDQAASCLITDLPGLFRDVGKGRRAA